MSIAEQPAVYLYYTIKRVIVGFSLQMDTQITI